MPLTIDADFPGGNIIVDEVRGDEVRLHQDLRDTTTDWFYWCLRLRGAAGRTLRFTFTRSRALAGRGPAASCDGGATWQWLGAGCVAGNGFTCPVPRDADELRLSFAMPYQQAHWRRFVAGLGAPVDFRCQPLCTTARGRAAEYALLGRRDRAPRHRVALTARHHCCEMMVNYALEGLIEWVLAGGVDDARWLRQHVQFFIVPFVDLDGVEDGDQGKNRRPHDHCRDYTAGLYATTRAIRQVLPAWGAGRLHVALDLHCPWIAGPHNEVTYLVGSPDARIAPAEQRFSAVLASVARGPLPFHADDFLPFGQAWNVPANFGAGKGFAGWAADLPGMVLASAIELPYAIAGGAEVNQATARAFGPDLGRALAAYLRALPAGA